MRGLIYLRILYGNYRFLDRKNVESSQGFLFETYHPKFGINQTRRCQIDSRKSSKGSEQVLNRKRCLFLKSEFRRLEKSILWDEKMFSIADYHTCDLFVMDIFKLESSRRYYSDF